MLTEWIAAGGMGDVWRANDVLLKREVAVKVLLPALVSDRDFITRFRAEAQMMAAVRHPDIAGVFDVGETTLADDTRVDYLVMEYVSGQPLSSQIQAAGKLSATETMAVLTRAALALHAAHLAGIVHRDVKPSNLLVKPDGSVVLVDFGVARSVDISGNTATNVVLGTAFYMAPEQVAGGPVSAATDIYALGAVGYCCLVGQPPFTGANPFVVATQHLRDQPPALPIGTPAAVVELIARAMAKEPKDRFPTAAAFAEAARAAQSSLPPVEHAKAEPAPAPTAPMPFQPPPGDPPTVRISGTSRRIAPGAIAAAAGVLVLGLVATLAFHPWASQPQLHTAETRPPAAPAPQTSIKKSAGGSAHPTQANPSAAQTNPNNPQTPIPTGRQATPSSTPTTTTATNHNPYTPAHVCGSGYHVIDSAQLVHNGAIQAIVYLLWNNANGRNCTVTLKKTALGVATTVSAFLQAKGHPGQTDSGAYPYLAGPVRVSASHICVKWGGSAGGASYISPYEYCG